MKTILIVEDDDNILRLEKDFLEIHGYRVIVEQTGNYNTIKKMSTTADLILLDLMLPEGDGFLLCKQLRESLDIPILIISALGHDTDIILGLGFGADDYITKPFNPNQLTARIKAHLSRYERLAGSKTNHQHIIEHDDLIIDLDAKTCITNGLSVDFTNKEFDILCLLASHQNKVLTKDQIYEAIWQLDALGDASTVAVHVKNIREKLSQSNPKVDYITTIWGVGYKFLVQYK